MGIEADHKRPFSPFPSTLRPLPPPSLLLHHRLPYPRASPLPITAQQPTPNSPPPHVSKLHQNPKPSPHLPPLRLFHLPLRISHHHPQRLPWLLRPTCQTSFFNHFPFKVSNPTRNHFRLFSICRFYGYCCIWNIWGFGD